MNPIHNVVLNYKSLNELNAILEKFGNVEDMCTTLICKFMKTITPIGQNIESLKAVKKELILVQQQIDSIENPNDFVQIIRKEIKKKTQTNLPLLNQIDQIMYQIESYGNFYHYIKRIKELESVHQLNITDMLKKIIHEQIIKIDTEIRVKTNKINITKTQKAINDIEVSIEESEQNNERLKKKKRDLIYESQEREKQNEKRVEKLKQQIKDANNAYNHRTIEIQPDHSYIRSDKPKIDFQKVLDGICNFLTPIAMGAQVYINKKNKNFNRQPNFGPPSFGPPSFGPPSFGPPSFGPPSFGPPSFGPPSFGPPSFGPPKF
ncbi:hypothetical protein M9Y10_018760 [Tritrichomonas musculus]|uniref:Uncharacterized protein n=1 Tax=Tritrichomonas musculus TaxID=1915356 RepID=A0ABR2HHN7_9EUKA